MAKASRIGARGFKAEDPKKNKMLYNCESRKDTNDENHAKSRKLLKKWKTTTHAVMKDDEKIAHKDQENMKLVKNQRN